MNKDIDSNFAAHPDTGDLLVKTGVVSISQAIVNLLQTDVYERPFQPTLAGRVRSLLFEPLNDLVADSMQPLIKQVINNYEPRANAVEVDVIANDSANAYEVTVAYQPTTGGSRVKFTVNLRRDI